MPHAKLGCNIFFPRRKWNKKLKTKQVTEMNRMIALTTILKQVKEMNQG